MSSELLLDRGPDREWWRPELVAGLNDGSGATARVAAAPADDGLAFWATMGFTFVLFTAPQELFPVLAPLRIGLVTAAVAITTCLLDRFVRRQPLIVLTRETRLAAGLAGWAIFTVPLSYFLGGSLSFLPGVYFKSLAIFWLFGHAVNTPVRLRRIVWAISLMALPMAGIALANFLSASFLPGVAEAPKRIVGSYAPLMANPNDLALMLNLILPLSVALLLTARRPALRTLLGAVICLDVAAVIVTFSRGGFLTLATIVGAYVWKLRARPERSLLWAALLLALACLPLLPSGYLARLDTITDTDSDITRSAEMRWDDMVSAAKFVVANPIVGTGIGVGALALQGETHGGAIHNVYLEYAVELGIPGLVLFLLLLVGSIRSVAVVQRRSAGIPALKDLFYLAEGIQISLLAFSVAALFHPVGYSVHFYYMAGLAVAVTSVWATQRSHAAVLDRSVLTNDGRQASLS